MNLPLPVQNASGDNAGSTCSPLALSIPGASAGYSWKILAVSLLDECATDRG